MSNAISSITLCKVPITPTHQIDFDSLSSQKSYFSSKAKHTYEKCRYQPRTANIKVKGYVDTLQDCNYGYYINSYNGVNKTFYFWIVKKDYLAREVTNLTIQIDVFQTWLFDFNFTPCMIEREHVDDDTFGLHTVPEDFELGDYVTLTRKIPECLTGNPCFLMATTDYDTGSVGGGLIGKTYSGCTIHYYAFDDVSAINTKIEELCTAGKGDAIAFIFTFPTGLLGNGSAWNPSTGSILWGEGIQKKTVTFNWNEQLQYFEWNGQRHNPYNGKLFTYPYNFITVKNASGGNVVLKLENFATSADIEFDIEGVLTQNPTISITPKNYCGKDFAIDDSITMSEYGLCSWNNDNYANWFAQHHNSINAQSQNATSSYNAQKLIANNNYNNANDNRNTNAEKGLINTALSTMNSLGSLNLLGATTNAIGGVANTYLDYEQAGRNANNDLANTNLLNNTNYQNTIRSIVASVQDAQVQPNTCKGSTSSCGLDVARNTASFFIEQTAIKPEYARIIDMYWQMFGYQVNTVKTPSFKTRTRWNYLKSVNCSVYGDIPQEDCTAINAMFNNGLTVWHDESFMYNYEIDNIIR